MGDSANMKYVIDEVGDPFRSSTQVKHWGDNLQSFMIARLGEATQHALRADRNLQLQRLQGQGAFEQLPGDISDRLVQIFLDYSYAVFPIFDRQDLLSLHRNNYLSALLANAIYLMGSIHCDKELLLALQLDSRYMASLTFYNRAKSLFDADYDSDGIANVQAALLLSNWWGGPMEPKDTWHWLGVAAGLAQSLGMHRRYEPSSRIDLSLTLPEVNPTQFCLLVGDGFGGGFGGRCT